MTTIQCPKCGDHSPIEDIPPSKRQSTSYYCKSCRKDIRKKQYWSNPEKERQYAKRTQFAHRLRRIYGLSLEEYEVLKTLQENKCAICEIEGTVEQRLVIDHDHATGKVRLLLCNNCNRGIGLLGDDAKRLQRAVEYLNRFNEVNIPSSIERT